MSTQPHHPMSSNNSLGSYDSLFDDDVGTLGGICFDLDVQQVVSNDGSRCHSSSWCKSSSSSCCSLCKLPAVSEAGEDNSNIFGSLGNAASVQVQAAARSLKRNAPEAEVVRDGSFMTCHPPKRRSCVSSCCGSHAQGLFQLPMTSISIPRSCTDHPSSALLKQPSSAVVVTSTDSTDYLTSSFIPDDALCHVVKFLDVKSLIRLRGCNKKLYVAASNNNAGWKDHCASLWSTKANVCSIARDMLAETNKARTIQEGRQEDSSTKQCSPKYTAMEAYKTSVVDAARRKNISFEEICFDASSSPSNEKRGITWSFRFKESAGRDWTSWDPWWSGSSSRKLVFLRDGSIKQVYPQGMESTVQVHHGTKLYDVFSERTVRRDGVDVPAPRIEMKWRFVNRPLDLPERPEGAYVRITVGGRDVPTYVVRRNERNWGFILESCWGVYASFELAAQVQATSLLGRGRRRLRRTRTGSRWVQIDDDSDNESAADGLEVERERMRNVRRRIDLFVEESAMTQDGYSQWREALLYNIGAVTLPEGNLDGTEEFDNAWQNAMLTR